MPSQYVQEVSSSTQRFQSRQSSGDQLSVGEDEREEEEEPEADVDNVDDEDEQDGHSIIGVSIGRTQDHFKSPRTPAAEKAAVIRGQDPFDTVFSTYRDDESDGPEKSHHLRETSQAYKQRLSAANHVSSPKRRSPSDGLDGAGTSESGADKAPSTVPARSNDKAIVDPSKKLVSFSLPSFPKFSSNHRFSMPTIDGALAWVRGSSSDSASQPKQPVSPRNRRHTLSEPQLETIESPIHRRNSLDSIASTAHSQAPQGTLGPKPLLRRSTSDGSLAMYRLTSRASSLGDDSRWTEVHDQVNSRFKAIKDSFADSNLRMPRFKSPWAEGAKPRQADSRSRSSSIFTSFSRSTEERTSEPDIMAAKGIKTPPSLSPTGGMSKTAASEHPEFTKALKRLTGDIVILGGYRGSVLRSAEPPNRQLWIPVKVGLNLRKVNLEVGLEPEDEERMEETIIPSGMLKHIGPVDISRRLFRRLRASRNTTEGKLRVWDYGYDWRLNPLLLSQKLEAYLERLPCNKDSTPAEQRGAIVLAHSLGGLVTRHVVNRRPDLFSSVVYLGVPQTCVNILGPLRNGDEVLLSSKVLTAQVNFTIRTSFALLPLDGACFVDEETKEEYPVDFFDPKTWEEYRLSPCIARPLPPLFSANQPENAGLVGSLMGSMVNALPSVNIRKSAMVKRLSRSASPGTTSTSQHGSLDNGSSGADESSTNTTTSTTTDSPHSQHHTVSEPLNTQMDHLPNPQELGKPEETSVSTAVTISKQDATRYLTRVLAGIKKFKQELAFNEHMAELYPPTAVIYGKSVPTVCGARVKGREGIKHADAYDNLMFASGDGVVLARAAQIPEGYKVARGGVVSSDRGHIGLLGDLEAIGKCLNAVLAEQKRREQRFDALRSGMGSALSEEPESM